MYAAKHTARLPDPFTTVALYADLSKATMENRRQLATITKALQNHKTPYKWGFPTKLLDKQNSCSEDTPCGTYISEDLAHHSRRSFFWPTVMVTGGAYQDPWRIIEKPSLHSPPPKSWKPAALLFRTCLPLSCSWSTQWTASPPLVCSSFCTLSRYLLCSRALFN